MNDLESLSDRELTARLRSLAGRDRLDPALLLRHVAELERRELEATERAVRRRSGGQLQPFALSR